MKMMPAPQAKQATDAQTQRDIIRAQTASQELKRILSELDKANAAFEVVLANQHLRWINEETSLNGAKKALLDEIKSLEERRSALLIPIEQTGKDAYTMLEASEILAEQADSKQEHFEQVSEELTRRLDDVSEKEQDLAIRERGIVKKEQALDAQAKMSHKMAADVTARAQDFLHQSEVRDGEISRREKALHLLELSLQSKEASLKQEYTFINEEKVRLADQRKTLERTISRLKQHG